MNKYYDLLNETHEKLTDTTTMEQVKEVLGNSITKLIKLDETPKKYITVKLEKNTHKYNDVIRDFRNNSFISNNKLLGEVATDIFEDKVVFTFALGYLSNNEDLEILNKLNESKLVDVSDKLTVSIREVK